MKINVQLPLAPMANIAPAGSAGSAEGVAVRNLPASTNLPQQVQQTGGALQARQASEQDLQRAVEALQRKVQATASNLQFSIDHATGRTVIKVTDANTHEVIRQIPPEEILHLDQVIERMQGLLLNKQG